MRLTTDKGEISLPEDFEFEIEVNNPFFSDEGTSSIPATLPSSAENLRLLDHPERPGRAKKYVRKQTALLQHGIFQRKCRMIVERSGKEDGIVCSLAFNESEMYSDIKGKELKELFSDTAYIAPYQYNLVDDILYATAYCGAEGASSLDFAAFPVAVDKNDEGEYMMLNEPDGETFASRSRNISFNDELISVPGGYGVTAFLWFHRFLALTFELCGYKVRRNDFAQEPFVRLVLLNSCSDTLCPGNAIQYKDLVPSMSVEELIVWLKDKFGAAVTMDKGYVDIVLIQNCLEASPDIDLTPYARDGAVLSYKASSRVILSCDTSLDGAEPPVETMAEFKKKYSKINKVLLDTDPVDNGIVFRHQLGKFVQISEYVSSPLSFNETDKGSNCFTYDRDNSEDSEKHESDDRYVPEVRVDGMLMPYIGDRLHFNTSIKGEEEDDEEQPIMLCWMFMENGKAFGTSQPYNSSGERMKYNAAPEGQTSMEDYPELTPDGLYPHCWKAYNELLLNNAPEIKVAIDFPESVIRNLDIMTPKLLNGQKVLIKSFSYTIGQDGVKCEECTLQIIPSYSDAVVDQPIDLVQLFARWTIYDNRQKAINSVSSQMPGLIISSQLTITDGLADYTEDDAPDYKPETLGIIEKYRKRTGTVRFVSPQATKRYDITWEEYFISK